MKHYLDMPATPSTMCDRASYHLKRGRHVLSWHWLLRCAEADALPRLIDVLTPLERVTPRVRTAIRNCHDYTITGEFTPILPREDGRLLVWVPTPLDKLSIGGWQYVEDCDRSSAGLQPVAKRGAGPLTKNL